jgi:hypothetical protein
VSKSQLDRSSWNGFACFFDFPAESQEISPPSTAPRERAKNSFFSFLSQFQERKKGRPKSRGERRAEKNWWIEWVCVCCPVRLLDICAAGNQKKKKTCVYSREKGLDGNLKKKGFERTVLARLFVFVFVSHWKTKSNFAPFSICRERERDYLCVFNYIRLAGPARLVSPSWTYLRTHRAYYPNSIKLDCFFCFFGCWPCAGPAPVWKKKNKKGKSLGQFKIDTGRVYTGTVGKPVGRHQIRSRVNSAQRHTERAAAARSVFRCIYRQWCMAQLYLFQQCTI